MAIRTYRPYTKSRRAMTNSTFEDITKSTPEKSLLAKVKKTGGRNNQGKITCRHIGGGNKRRYRIIDFRRRKDDIPATVKAIEYDPNRNANIALICYADGVKSYIIEPQGLKVGDVIVSGAATDIKVGNCLELQNIPEGTFIHAVELQPGKGAQMCRAAGTSAQILGAEGKYVIVRLASGEVRKLLKNCRATIGIVSNDDHNLEELGKAGARRWRGVRPTVRGVVMNPVDHPHGGGEGKTGTGRPPMSPWGQLTRGYRTRNNKRTDNMIVQRRYRK